MGHSPCSGFRDHQLVEPTGYRRPVRDVRPLITLGAEAVRTRRSSASPSTATSSSRCTSSCSCSAGRPRAPVPRGAGRRRLPRVPALGRRAEGDGAAGSPINPIDRPTGGRFTAARPSTRSGWPAARTPSVLYPSPGSFGHPAGEVDRWAHGAPDVAQAARFAIAGLVLLTASAVVMPGAAAAPATDTPSPAAPDTVDATDPTTDPTHRSTPSTPASPLTPVPRLTPPSRRRPRSPPTRRPPIRRAGLPPVDVSPRRRSTSSAPLPGDDEVAEAVAAITVTPDTELVSGQSGTVAGTGSLRPADRGAHVRGVRDVGCRLRHQPHHLRRLGCRRCVLHAVEVRRLAHTQNGTVDVPTHPGTCRMIAANPTDTTEAAFALISFDPRFRSRRHPRSWWDRRPIWCTGRRPSLRKRFPHRTAAC